MRRIDPSVARAAGSEDARAERRRPLRIGWLAALLGLTLLPALAIGAPWQPALAADPHDGHGAEQIAMAQTAQQRPRAAASGATSWWFAEGFTGPGFNEYLTILNLGAAQQVTITYYIEGQVNPTLRQFQLAANSRTTVTVHANADVNNPGGLGPNQTHSTKVEANNPIVVERPMYFTYNGSAGSNITGGHNVIGATRTAGVWDFAEGFTGTNFDEYLTIQNPGATAGAATITYFIEGQANPTVKQINLPANSRTTVPVHEAGANGGLGRGFAHSTKVSANVPIVVERPMYFNYLGTITGGHNVIGAAAAPAVCMAALRSEDEIPPTVNASTGVGAVRLAIDPATGVILGEWVVRALNNNINNYHIHEGAAGVQGPVRVDFSIGNPFPQGANTVAGIAFRTTTTTTVAQAQAILANPANFYVNVHTAPPTGNPPGEVRGQLFCTA
jgi:hypothetical protein